MAMKAVVFLAFLLSLVMIFLAFKYDLPWLYLVILLILIGFNPYLWEFKDNIVSDIPFLVFIYLSLFLIYRAYRSEQKSRRRILDALLIGASIYLAYGTRSIGLILLLSLFVYDFIKNKRTTVFAIIIALVVIALSVVQGIFLHNDRSYSGQLAFGLKATVEQVWEYVSGFSSLLAQGTNKGFRLGLFGIMFALAAVGYLARIKERITIFEIFAIFYLVPLIVLKMPADVRYLLPVVPLFFFYAFLGVKFISNTREREFAILSILTISLSIAYVTRYAELDYGPIREGVTKIETQQLFDYVKRETDANDVFIFRKPRSFALFTGRRTSVWHRPSNDQELWDYFRQIHANYLVLGPKDMEPSDQEYLGGFIERHRDKLQKTYANADFRVYRVIAGK